MTIVSFSSLKGAPGVTTLSRLVGATWPEGRKVMLLECDASGGDLAARFQLSARMVGCRSTPPSDEEVQRLQSNRTCRNCPGGSTYWSVPKDTRWPRQQNRLSPFFRRSPGLRGDRGMFWSTWAGWCPENRGRSCGLSVPSMLSSAPGVTRLRLSTSGRRRRQSEIAARAGSGSRLWGEDPIPAPTSRGLRECRCLASVRLMRCRPRWPLVKGGPAAAWVAHLLLPAHVVWPPCSPVEPT